MLDYCNLIDIIHTGYNSKIRNVEVYGYISRYVDTPDYFATNTDFRCVLAEMQVFGVAFSNGKDIVQDFIGDYNLDHRYFCNGSLLVSISEDTPIQDWYTVVGDMSIPRGKTNIVNLLKWRKGATGFQVVPCFTGDIVLENWSESLRMIHYLRESANRGSVCIPQEVCKLPSFIAEEGQIGGIGVATNLNLSTIVDIEPEIASSHTIEEPIKTREPKQVSELERNIYFEANKQEVKTDFTQDIGKSSTVDIDIEDRETEIKHSIDNDQIRTDIKPKGSNYNLVKDSLLDCMDRKNEFLNKLKSEYSLSRSEASPYIKHMFDNLIEFWKSKPNKGHTGQSLLKEYIFSYKASNKKVQSKPIGDMLLTFGDNMLKFSLRTEKLLVSEDYEDVAVSLFREPEIVYANIIGIIVGVRPKDLEYVCNVCLSMGISFAEMINRNPYLITMLTGAISFSDIEHIALCVGKANDKNLERLRNVSILYDYTKRSNGGDTLYSENRLFNQGELGVVVTRKNYSLIIDGTSTLPLFRQSDLKAYINSDLSISDWIYPQRGWINKYINAVLPMTVEDTRRAIKDFTESGLGVYIDINGTKFLTSSEWLKKDLFIYDKLRRLSENSNGIPDEFIAEHINKFEEIKRFKLEPQQVQSLYLLKNGVGAVTGGAGSGKTTVSECFVYILESYNSNIVINFAAPTGKASKRLQEVVKRPVKTLHSMFKIGVGEDNAFDEDEDFDIDMPNTLIIDETAMTSTDLLYNVLLRVDDNVTVYFFGDIEQAPPIAKGLPFKNMLEYIPFVRLGISKRSSENSKINKNNDIITKHSEKDNWLPLEEGNDFKLIECADENIADAVYNICAYHLGKTEVKPPKIVDIGLLEPDNIQVIAPINKSSYSWGASALNRKLQDLFNPKTSTNSFKHSIGKFLKEFRINDRVIHVDTDNSVPHYENWKEDNILELKNHGLTNGDVGKIRGIVKAKDKKFILQSERSKSVRNDKEYEGDNDYFIVVEYSDSITGGIFFAFYPAKKLSISLPTEPAFESYELGALQLAYALTTHKMQGSEIKLAICPIGQIKMKGFLNRNIVYTGVSRAKVGCYAVGSVSNSMNSALSVARRIQALRGVATSMDMLID